MGMGGAAAFGPRGDPALGAASFFAPRQHLNASGIFGGGDFSLLLQQTPAATGGPLTALILTMREMSVKLTPIDLLSVKLTLSRALSPGVTWALSPGGHLAM